MTMASSKKKLQGLVAATITPMTENGEINFSVIGQYVDYLVEEQGVKSIFVNGTTGEGLSLSISERRQVAEEWVTKGRNKLDQVVIHVGALSLKESQELAKHAAEIGADGIAVIAPFFLKPWNKDVLINFLKEVAAAAPALPFYYYHIPALTGIKIRAEELLDGIQDKIPTFQGLKFSDTDLLDFGQCVDQNQQRQFAFLFGVDEMGFLCSSMHMADHSCPNVASQDVTPQHNLVKCPPKIWSAVARETESCSPVPTQQKA
ncbi:N-acetylneuraminate lyase isoform 7-T19 [Trichechus inunguis]